jgi:excisionase family DNA binding protein
MQDPITSTTAAKILNVAESTIRLWLDRGVLPSRRIDSGIRLIERADAVRLAAQREQERRPRAAS